MRRLLIVIALALVFAACRGQSTSPDGATPPNGRTPEEQFLLDYRAHLTGSWRATYEVNIKDVPEEFRGLDKVTWFKQGQERQRFDFGDYTYGDLEAFTVHTEGDDSILMCSASLPVDPRDEKRTGQLGACYGGSGSAGDGIGNILYSLGLPLSYTSSNPADTDTDTKYPAITRYAERQIAGLGAHCYAFKPRDGYEGPDPELCLGDSGTLLYRDTPEFVGRVIIEATIVTNLAPTDFDLPYPHVIEPED